jgi:hypothetical protein
MMVYIDDGPAAAGVAAMDAALGAALSEFGEWLYASGWWGREREVVSQFVMGYFLQQFDGEGVLHDPRQVGIEVAVPQIPGPNRKAQVTKDLVVWPEAAMTCWNEAREPCRYPLAVVEWKARRRQQSEYDIEWLTHYSVAHEGFAGYAVVVNPSWDERKIRCARIYGGDVDREWFQA